MADEEERPSEESEDDGQTAFWERFGVESEAAYERVLGKLSAQVDEEEAQAEVKPKPKPAPKTEEEDEEESGTTPAPTEAQRQRDGGRVGPGARSPYWQRAQRWLYGPRR